MPKKGYRRAASGWKRRTFSGKKSRKWAIKRMPMTKQYNMTAPVNLGTGVPAALRMGFSFTRTVVLGTTLGVPVDYVFRGNSLYDPDFTGVGAQPLYFDQMLAIYNHFSVRGCAIEVEFQSVDNVNPLICVIYPSKVSSAAPTSTNVSQLMQVPGAVVAPLSVRGGGKDSVKVKAYFTTSTFFPDYSFSAPDFRGSAGSNPPAAGSWFWHVVTYNADAGSQTSNAVANVRLTYYADLFGVEASVFS